MPNWKEGHWDQNETMQECQIRLGKEFDALSSFTKTYSENVRKEQVEAYCPECNQIFHVFPEHVERAECGSCKKALLAVDS